MIKYTIQFSFNIRVDYKLRVYKDVSVIVYADDAKAAVAKAQKMLWGDIYDVIVTSISAEEILGNK